MSSPCACTQVLRLKPEEEPPLSYSRACSPRRSPHGHTKCSYPSRPPATILHYRVLNLAFACFPSTGSRQHWDSKLPRLPVQPDPRQGSAAAQTHRALITNCTLKSKTAPPRHITLIPRVPPPPSMDNGRQAPSLLAVPGPGFYPASGQLLVAVGPAAALAPPS